MKEGPFIGRPHVLGRLGADKPHDHIGIVSEMEDGLGRGIGQHAYPDSRAEHHRKPRKS